MSLLRRRDRPPAALLALLERGERVVSWAPLGGAGAVAATPRGLWWPTDDGWRLIGWHVISKATWRDGVLAVVEADVDDDLVLVDRAPVTVVLDQPQDLPPAVRKRVEANIVSTQTVAAGGGVVRLVARRVPGTDGVRWWARLEQGAQDSEELRSALRARVALPRAGQPEA